jgi:hypothetical protein
MFCLKKTRLRQEYHQKGGEDELPTKKKPAAKKPATKKK